MVVFPVERYTAEPGREPTFPVEHRPERWAAVVLGGLRGAVGAAGPGPAGAQTGPARS